MIYEMEEVGIIIKRNHICTLLACLMLLLLTGCGMSERDKKLVFKELKEQNLIEVGDSDFEDYSEIINVSNAPVPGGGKSYLYQYGERCYYLVFDQYKDEEKEEVYMVSVSEYGEDYRNYIQYFFHKEAWTGKMTLFDKEYGSFEKSFHENQEQGIIQLRYINSSVSVDLLKEDDKRSDERLLRYVKNILEAPDCTATVICNIGGETYESRQVKVREFADKYVISADFGQVEKAELISWQYKDVVLEELNE